MKQGIRAVTKERPFVHDGETGADAVVGEKSGTTRDVQDMKRLGKAQLFRVWYCPVVGCIEGLI